MKIILSSAEYAQLDLLFEISKDIGKYESIKVMHRFNKVIIVISPYFLGKCMEPMMKIKHNVMNLIGSFKDLNKFCDNDERKVRINGQYRE